MATVSDFRKRLMKVDVKSLTKAIIKQEQLAIVDLNREDQIFDKGIDSKGRSLSVYGPATQRIYDKAPPADTGGMFKTWGQEFNLFWSGKSYHGFKAYMKGKDKLIITTNTRGRKLLLDNGGPDIFGLTPENAEIVNWVIIAPELNDAIKKELL